ncbi:MAG TPA: hypothetical protein VK763_09460 [Terriglobales bacterium]|nr:hypothetical protein [Terriglobales bacterium]
MRLAFRIAFALLFLGVIFPVAGRGETATKKTRLKAGQSYCSGVTPCVLTSHNDNNRDGVNPNESVLKASTLSATNHPVPKWLAITDGQLYAQPLYIHQLSIGGGLKNVVYAVTENNSVYAFDSDSTSSSGTVLTQVNLNNASDLSPGSTEIAVPYTDLPASCTLIAPEVGITSTPVIDVSVTPPVMYVVSKHEDVDSQGVKTYRHKLHGLYADTLQEIPGSPVLIDSNFEANYAHGLNPLDHLQRPGLALIPSSNGASKVWVSWGSNCDRTPYFGFAIEFTYNYGASGFSNTYTVVNLASSCVAQPCQNGVWMSGAAPVVDANGNMYIAVGNGADEFQGEGEYSNSIVRINDSGLQDYYTPPDYHGLNVGKTVVACTNPHPASCPSPCTFDSTGQYCQFTLERNDWDLGAGGITLLSPSFKLTNPEIMASGKQGMIYVAYADSLGHIDSQSVNSTEYACTPSNAPASGALAQCFQGYPVTTDPTHNDSGLRSSAAFLAGNPGSPYNFLYAAAINDVLKVFLFENHGGVGRFLTTAGTAITPHLFKAGASPSVTWNKSPGGNIKDGIVWAMDTIGQGNVGGPAAKPEVIYAYRAIPTSETPNKALGKELWDSSAYDSTNPGNPGAVKFGSPTVVDGKIFMGGGAPGYQVGSANCPVPGLTLQPTACGAIAMYQ